MKTKKLCDYYYISNYTYTTPNGETIDISSELKDLGITIDSDFTFTTHIHNIIAKGKRMAGWALRAFESRDTKTMSTLLKQLVIPMVEYGCEIWSPVDQTAINLIESVQRSFTSKLEQFQAFNHEAGFYTCATEYADRLKALGIYSLERRRERYQILYMYKVIIGKIPNPDLTIEANMRTGLNIKPKQCLKQTVPTKIRNMRNDSVFSTAPRLFNTLPPHLRSLVWLLPPTKESVDTFKRELDKYLRTIPDRPGTKANSLLS